MKVQGLANLFRAGQTDFEYNLQELGQETNEAGHAKNI